MVRRPRAAPATHNPMPFTSEPAFTGCPVLPARDPHRPGRWARTSQQLLETDLCWAFDWHNRECLLV